MRLMGDVLFNLMLNAVGSVWLGIALAALIFAVLRPGRSWLSVVALLLPFAKLLWDLRSGIPASSFFWASEHGVKQRLGFFQIGGGIHPWGPSLDGRLWALHAGGRSPQSAADLASRALRFRVSSYAAPLLSLGALSVSIFKCSARGLRYAAFGQRIRVLLRAEPRVEWRTLGRRRVRVYASRAYTGVPFAGGLVRPYVVLPERLNPLLSSVEREAVIEHELGHIAHFDLALLLPVEFLCELFWFVPGVSALLGRLRSVLEQRADDCAVAAGIARESIVNALLIVAELAAAEPSAAVLAMSRGPSSLRVRVQRLLAPEVPRVEKRWLGVARALLLVWLVLGTLQAAACGNHL